MLAILLLLFIICLWGIRFTKMNPDYISLDGTKAIKGVFAIIILCSHMGGYLTLSDSFSDKSYLWIMGYLGQTMVAPYLFYSGYGIYHSFQHKPDYVYGFFRKRVLKTLVHFDLAILLFILVQAFFSIHYPLRNYFLCWIGWESVGNSNWFIFVILALYVISLFGLMAEKKSTHMLLPVVTVFSIILWIALRFIVHKENWWVDTIAAFPLGMCFRSLQDYLEKQFRFNQTGHWFVSFILILFLFISWHHIKGIDVFGISSCLFCLVITFVAMKVRIGNPVLAWLGENAFAIYILQRLPMIILSYYGVNQSPAIFIPTSIIITLLLAGTFTLLTNRLDRQLFHA